MRYDTEVFFQTLTDGEYDQSTGNYADSVTSEVKRWANVMDTQTETLRLVYGELKQGSLTIQLQNPYTDAFDRIRVLDKIYAVDYRRNLREKQTFIVSEVQ